MLAGHRVCWVVAVVGEVACRKGNINRNKGFDAKHTTCIRTEESLPGEGNVSAVSSSETKKEAGDTNKFIIEDANVSKGEGSDAKGVCYFGAKDGVEDGEGREGGEASKEELGGFATDRDNEF